MTALDVRNLAQIELATSRMHPDAAPAGVWTAQLPGRATPNYYVERDKAHPGGPSPEVAISLSNLERLGCVMHSRGQGTDARYLLVALSPFGRAFIEACTK
jgi:hypothetical protein